MVWLTFLPKPSLCAWHWMPTSMKGLILYCFFDRHFVPGTSIVLGGVGCCCCSRQEKRVHTADSLAVSQYWSSSPSVVASLSAPTFCRGHCCSARSQRPFLLILCMHATSSTSFPFPAPPTSSRSTQVGWWWWCKLSGTFVEVLASTTTRVA